MLLKLINILSQARTRWPIAHHGFAHKTLHHSLLCDARGDSTRFAQRKSCHKLLGHSTPAGKSAFFGAQNGWHTSKVTQVAFERKGFCTYRKLFQQSKGSPRSYSCTQCSRSFESASKLADHIHSKHNPSEPPKSTPLDDFFRTYEVEKGFQYDRTKVPSDSFTALRVHCGWKRGDSNCEYARQKYFSALREELQVWFGGESDIANWHALCRAVGIAPLPQKCSECQAALRGKHVNLVDLIQWARAGSDEDERVRVFQTVSDLSRYCRETGKYLPLRDVETAGYHGQVVIRHLLRHLM